MHQIKLAWLKVHYKDDFNKISKREFFTNFLQILENMSIPWNCRDENGNLKYPTLEDYDYASKNCFSKYDWDGCFKQFEMDEMTESDKRKLRFYNKRTEKKLIKNEEQYDRIDAHIDKLLLEQEQDDIHNEYRIAKDIESKNQLDEKSRQILGLDKEEQNDTQGIITVPLNPEHEDQHIRDIWTERARQDVIPR